jgi:hypothetical protein
MKTRITTTLKVVATIILAWATATIDASAANVTATLDPARIALGESAQLSITVSGGDSLDAALPTVSGLEFTPGGQSSSYQSINGATTASVSVLYQVTPNRTGIFTIPAIRLPGGGSSQPLVLQVLKRTDGLPSNLPPPNAQSGTADEAPNAKGEAAFLRVVLPKREFYVGELVPVQVKAYFRAGMSASLNGLPVLNSDAFTLNKLDEKPDQAQETIDGRPYTVVTWNSALAAVKAGDYALNIELPVTVRVRESHRRGGNPLKQFLGNSPFDDPMFDDSFFDNFFGGMTEKPITLRMDADNVKILPLPNLGRPADFSGAVGKFDVTSEAAPTQSTTGDPLTLRLKVSGQGNFDRVASRGLASSADWKTYQPSARFEATDSAGDEGTKTFEQAVVPLKAGSESVPALTFSYFDADTRQYVTRATTPIPVEVSPGSGSPLAATLPASPSTPSHTPLANPSSSDLAINQVETGKFVSSLRPVLFVQWFIALQGVPVMALAAVFLVQRRRQRLAHDPQRTRNRAVQAAVREQLLAMEQALAANSAPVFFTAARQAVQEQLALRWQLSAAQITTAEINRRLNGDGNDLRTLFAAADAVIYSGQRVSPEDLKRWKDLVIQQLRKLEEP